jgi:outer membrane receptor protein involved in Fe transport
VNLRTADPTPDHQFGFDFTGGQFDMVKGLGRASGPLKQWGGYYVSAAKEQNHGYYVNKTTDDYTDGNWALFGKLTFTHDSKSFGSVSFNRVDSDNSTPTNEPIIDGQLLHVLNPRFDRLTNMNIPGPNYSQGESRLTLNYTRELSPMFKITEVFGYRDVRLQFIDDGDFIGTPFDFEANTISMYPFSQLNNEDIIYQELRAELTPKKVGRMKNTAIVGWSYEWNRSSSASDFIFDDPDLFGFTINYLNPVIPPESTWQHDGTSRFSHSKITGIFGQYMIEPAPRLIVTAGGRYDRLDLDTSANSGPTIVYDFDAFSPKVSATVKLAGLGNDSRPTVNVYGAYSQAFLPPRRPSTLTPADVELNLQPEDISNYEAGVKGSLANGRVSFDAAVFHMTEDGVVLNTFQGPFLIPTNSGQLRYNGVETGLGYAVSTKASAYVNASFYRSKFGDFVIQSEDGDEVLTGNRVPIAPNYVVNWGLTARPVPSIEAVLNVKHIGDMAANNDNSFIIDPANLVDAAVTWRRGPLRVTLSAHNLFNEEYYWNADGDVADPGRPRQVLVTVSVLAK